MLILLPPSETKRDGGAPGSSLDLATLGFPSLDPTRRVVLAGLRDIATDEGAMRRALKLGPKQHAEVERNRRISSAPVLAAMDRYSGVLYDALDARSLGAAARRFAARHVVVHSALFGLVRASDGIPAYRFSHDSRLPGLSLGKAWRGKIASELAAQSGLTLDLRSRSYVALGAAGPTSWYLNVVTEDAAGTRRALNHFNKTAKGEFVRQLSESGIVHSTVASLIDWARASGIRLNEGEPGELVLIV